MFEYIKYRNLLKKLQRGKNKLKREYDSQIGEAKSDKDKRNMLIQQAMGDLKIEDEDIRELHTQYLRDIAKTLMVPLLDSKDELYWENNRYSLKILTEKGIYELNKKIRLEKKERRDVIFSWLTILIGIIGALIGLLSVINK